MTYALLIVFIRSIVEGLKSVVPAVFANDVVSKIVVFVLSGVFVFGYGVDALKDMGHPSLWPALDYAVTIVAVAIATMGLHDILDFFANQPTKGA
jgi:hypothetical protein